MALLVGALRQYQLYRPTQDPEGRQRMLLQQLADTALGLAQGQRPAAVQQRALEALQGILAVEHRVIVQQLPLLWRLLLSVPRTTAADGE